jgi:D-hydroxyproline dehydrogenase subunit beta
MSNSTDAIVVGAGIIGAACAWFLSRAGLRVTVVDPNPVGSVTTAAGMGHVVVIDEPGPEFALTLYARRMWEEAAAELTPECGRRAIGTLWIATDDEEMDAARAKQVRLTKAGVQAELLDGQQVVEAEPQLRSGLRGGLLVPGDSVVNPPAAARWMLERAGVLKERLIVRAAIAIEPGRVRLDDGKELRAGVIVNAAGLAAKTLMPALPLRSRKGQLALTEPRPGFCRHEVVELGYIKHAQGKATESVSFNVQPRVGGEVLIGSSRQFGADHPAVEPGMMRKMIDRAVEFMPRLADLRIDRSWTGFRAATPDSFPLIGPHPTMPGIYIAAGHEGIGVTASLATGAMIADMVTGKTPAIPAAPYDPARFPELRNG